MEQKSLGALFSAMMTGFDFGRAARYVREILGKDGVTGFPHDLYKDQKYALEETMCAFGSKLYDNVIIIAPTGSGKSGISMGIGMAAHDQGEQTMILTPTRQLQYQQVQAFKSVKQLRSFKGKSNYSCLLYEDSKGSGCNADNAPCSNFNVSFDPHEDMRTRFMLQAAPPETDHPQTDEINLKHALKWLEMDEWTREAAMDSYQGEEITWKSQFQTKLCTDMQICPYRSARDAAQDAAIALMNLKGYFVWNTLAKEAPYFKPRTFTVFDECHTIEDMARDLYTLEVSDNSLCELYSEILGPSPDGKPWVSFANINGAMPNDFLRSIYMLNSKALIKNMEQMNVKGEFGEFAEIAGEAGARSPQAKLIKYHKILKIASDPRANFAKQVLPPGPDNRYHTLQVTPVDLPPTFRSVYGKYNVFMSATVADVDVFCASLCLDRKRTKVIEIGDTFPVEHRPIVSLPVATVSKVEIDKDPGTVYTPLAETLSDIALTFQEHKILVHTSSYVFGQKIIDSLSSLAKYRVLYPRNGVENKEMIRTYANRADHTPYILISPACREGYDFEGDLCRIQVFMKCPFPSLGDPVIKRKLEGRGGKAWYAAKVATGIRQQYGRSTRNASDFSVTFFLDKKLIEFIEKHPKLFPREFHEAMRIGSEMPDWKKLEITTQLSIDGEKISY